MKSEKECRIFFEKISEFIDGEIDDEKRILIEEHIRECKPCLKYIDSLKIIKECLKKEGEIEPEICEIVKECVKKFLSEKNG
jgi:predicted anti-sigma-YlaC factor YlaD